MPEINPMPDEICTAADQENQCESGDYPSGIFKAFIIDDT
jgi:hypothetical protein